MLAPLSQKVGQIIVSLFSSHNSLYVNKHKKCIYAEFRFFLAHLSYARDEL